MSYTITYTIKTRKKQILSLLMHKFSTSSDVAYFLNITKAYANRILNELFDNGLVKRNRIRNKKGNYCYLYELKPPQFL